MTFILVTTAKKAAAEVFQVIERESNIDSMSREGDKPDDFIPKIKFQKVSFALPQEPGVLLLKNVSLEVSEGETVAIVGLDFEKSILVHLLLRFYETKQGEVLFSDHDVKDLNIGWLRSKIGLVGREPVLFEGTISDNIWLGDTKRAASKADITEAAELSGANDFIQYLPMQYETVVGGASCTGLSNLEKQKIAIARALVKKPSLMLFDSATSALDEDEAEELDDAIMRAKAGRTTVIVADKITSAVQKADRIIVLDRGEVKESGSHDVLMRKKGLYRHIYTTQKELSMETLEPIDHEEVEMEKIERRKSRIFSTVSEFNMDMSCFKDRSLERPSSRVNKYSTKRWLKFMDKDLLYLLIGSVAATVFGLGVPFYAIIYGEYIQVLEYMNVEDLVTDTETMAKAFIQLSVLVSVSYFISAFMLGLASERLITKVRSFAFKSILSQELSWFDEPEQSVEELSKRLSKDSQKIRHLCSSRIMSLFQTLGTLIACVAFSFLPQLADGSHRSDSGSLDSLPILSFSQNSRG